MCRWAHLCLLAFLFSPERDPVSPYFRQTNKNFNILRIGHTHSNYKIHVISPYNQYIKFSLLTFSLLVQANDTNKHYKWAVNHIHHLSTAWSLLRISASPITWLRPKIHFCFHIFILLKKKRKRKRQLWFWCLGIRIKIKTSRLYFCKNKKFYMEYS